MKNKIIEIIQAMLKLLEDKKFSEISVNIKEVKIIFTDKNTIFNFVTKK